MSPRLEPYFRKNETVPKKHRQEQRRHVKNLSAQGKLKGLGIGKRGDRDATWRFAESNPLSGRSRGAIGDRREKEKSHRKGIPDFKMERLYPERPTKNCERGSPTARNSFRHQKTAQIRMAPKRRAKTPEPL